MDSHRGQGITLAGFSRRLVPPLPGEPPADTPSPAGEEAGEEPAATPPSCCSAASFGPPPPASTLSEFTNNCMTAKSGGDCSNLRRIGKNHLRERERERSTPTPSSILELNKSFHSNRKDKPKQHFTSELGSRKATQFLKSAENRESLRNL